MDIQKMKKHSCELDDEKVVHDSDVISSDDVYWPVANAHGSLGFKDLQM